MADYTSYWKPLTARSNSEGDPLDHSASEQYKRVSPGDVLWIVSVEAGHLFLLGRGEVDEVMTDEEAVNKLGDNIWEAAYHVIFREPRVALKWRDITEFANELRFQGPKPTLPNNPKLWGNSLQTMRKLTPESAELLWSRLSNGTVPAEIAEKIETPYGAGFGDPISNREVEKAAIDFVTTHYSTLGWNVTSKEREKCGYDLLCESNEQIHHVEVKGVKGSIESVILTKNEVSYLDHSESFVCIVTSALSSPQLTSYTGEEFKKLFKLEPFAIIATKV